MRLPMILCDCLIVNRFVLSVGLAIYARVTQPRINCTNTRNANTNARLIYANYKVVFFLSAIKVQQPTTQPITYSKVSKPIIVIEIEWMSMTCEYDLPYLMSNLGSYMPIAHKENIVIKQPRQMLYIVRGWQPRWMVVIYFVWLIVFCFLVLYLFFVVCLFKV